MIIEGISTIVVPLDVRGVLGHVSGPHIIDRQDVTIETIGTGIVIGIVIETEIEGAIDMTKKEEKELVLINGCVHMMM